MEFRRIGSLDVSVVAVSLKNFGWNVDQAATQEVVDAAIEAGINFFDTADVYGGTKSEEFLGKALGSRRDKVVVATKFGHKVSDEKFGAAPEYIRQAVEDSLRRLGTDRIDLYQLHRPDDITPIADTLGALDELVKAGKVREIGCSNFSVQQIEEAEAAVPPGGARFVSVQNHLSLIKRDAATDVVPECEKRGIGFLPYFPLANGLLTGKYRKGQPLPAGTRIEEGGRFGDWLTEANFDLIEGLVAFSEKRGHTILELAFAWLLAFPAVSSVIAGATRIDQIRKNAAAGEWKLTCDDLKEIDSIIESVAVVPV